MNVLLTFAQFERELAADRIRDKKRLMTARGMWSGGRPPLGYDLVSHRLVVNEGEAATVRHIYELYVALGSIKAVTRQCRHEGLISKIRPTEPGARIGGHPLSIGSITQILRNPIYAGELKLGEGTCRGLHDSIVPQELWTNARMIREAHTKKRVTEAPEDLLGGLTFDCYGRRMKASRFYLKNGWVALYVSFQADWARARQLKRLRLNAKSFEKVVVSSIHGVLADRSKMRAMMIDEGNQGLELAAAGARVSRRLEALDHGALRSVLQTIIESIEVSRERIIVQLRSADMIRLLEWDGVGNFARDRLKGRSTLVNLEVPCVGVVRLERRLRLPVGVNGAPGQPNQPLVSLIKEARSAQVIVDEYRGETADQLAGRIARSTGFFMRLLRLNYLAPDIVAAILDGTQPAGLTRKQLLNSDLPLDWALQRRLFAFPDQPPLQTTERY